jgi:thiol-disulfide isomerase/thioredoxin
MNEVLLRFLEAVGLMLAGWLLYRLANTAVLARAGKAAPAARAEALVPTGRPAVLYFTTPACVTCKSFQRPQLRRLEGMLGNDVQVVEVDAQARPELAGQWGVMSVPTTFVLDAAGKPRHVNHGAVSAEKLAEQLRGLARVGVQ